MHFRALRLKFLILFFIFGPAFYLWMQLSPWNNDIPSAVQRMSNLLNDTKHCSYINQNFKRRHNTRVEQDLSEPTDNNPRSKLDFLRSKGCDYQCLLLQCELLVWPTDKPKAFIYLLVRRTATELLISGLKALEEYFNNRYGYPIVIFHENEFHFDRVRRRILSETTSKIYFQRVDFAMPDFLPRNLKPRSCDKFTIGYKHMCRFHAKGFYEQPIIRGFEYAWRLDDDSQLLKPIEFDVFEYMRTNNLLYSYAFIDLDNPDCVGGLWPSVNDYINRNNISYTFFHQWNINHIFYNNFEISKLSLWLSDDYRKYVDYIDRLGGIYYHRWGDAPIKTLFVTMFVQRRQTYCFDQIAYKHKNLENLGHE